MTNQSRLGALKRQELKQSVSDGGEDIVFASLDSMTNVFWPIQ